MLKATHKSKKLTHMSVFFSLNQQLTYILRPKTKPLKSR